MFAFSSVRRSAFDVRIFLFRSTLDGRRSMFDVRVFLPFGEALEVRRAAFDVRCSRFLPVCQLELRRISPSSLALAPR